MSQRQGLQRNIMIVVQNILTKDIDLKSREANASSFRLYSEIEPIPSSVSKLENCGLVESSTEVVPVFAGCIAKKW